MAEEIGRISSRDGLQIYRSVCRLCHGGCGAFLYVKNGRLEKVQGDPKSPLNKGWMCIKGLRTPEITNHPSRLTEPLRRKGPRGSGEWEKVSWEEVLEEIAVKIGAIRNESGPESIAIGQGTGRHHYMHVVRFANALGTPNWFEPGLAQCFIPRITVSHLTYGGFVVGDYYGAVRPQCILFWGHNPLVSSADGELSFVARRALKQGAYGVAIDPRRSETARKCGLWLPIRPGTDAALALAMIHIIIKEAIYDKVFVENWTVGFEALRDHVMPFTPEWAESITWVPATDIVKAARIYATRKPSIIEWGVAIEQNTNSLQTVRAIALLRGLTGNLDIPGGDILGMNILKTYPTLRERLPREISQKRLGGETYKLLAGWRAWMPSAHIPTLFQAMRTGKPYRVRALLIFGSNPLVSVANSKEVYAALLKLNLLIVAELFMTPTASFSDYVLPASFWPEVNQVAAYPLVAENLVMAQQQVVQRGQCQQDEWIMDELGKRLGLPGFEENFEDLINDRLSPLGIDFQQLKEKGYVYPPHQYRKYEQKGFRTPSKKVELFCRTLERMGYNPLPTYKEPPESPCQSPELAKDFPYILTTGSRRAEFFHSEQRQIQSLRKRRPDPVVEIHPAIGLSQAIKSGDWVRISSPRGSIRLKAFITEDIHPKVINLDHGWWFPEKSGPDYGFLESNANVLTNDGPPYDPAFGSYALKGLLCRIEKE
jgi:thiosulfate reductase/polysulfide reductase chain A